MYQWLRKPGILLFVPLIVVLLGAMACEGKAGPSGPSGAQGPAGPQGPKGDKGDTGNLAVVPGGEAPSAMSKLTRIDPVTLAGRYGENPKVGGIFKNVIPQNFTSHDCQQDTGGCIETVLQLYNNLIMSNPYDWTADIMLDLADSWEISADGKKYTFNLHDGVEWHDGAPFTSADVEYTFNRILNNGVIAGNTETGSFQNVLWEAIVESTEAVGPDKVEINLLGSTDSILKLLSSGYAYIVPKHISEQDPLNAIKIDPRPIGTGPFMLTQDMSTTYVEHEKNPNYFKDGLPFLDGIESRQVLDTQARVAAVLTKEIYWSDSANTPTINASEAESVAAQDTGIVHKAATSFLFMFLQFNTEKPPFDDIRVRQAIVEAVDKNDLLYEGLGNQHGTVGTGLFPLGPWALPKDRMEKLPGYGPDMDVRRANAKRLLDEYEAENGKIDWSQVDWSVPLEHEGQTVSEIYQSQLKEYLGIDLTLNTKEMMVAWGNGMEGSYHALPMYGLIDFDDPTGTFNRFHITGAVWGMHRHHNPDMDAKYYEQVFLTDTEERKRLAWEIDEWFATEAALNYLYWSANDHIMWDFVKGYEHPSPFRSTNSRMEHIWLDL